MPDLALNFREFEAVEIVSWVGFASGAAPGFGGAHPEQDAVFVVVTVAVKTGNSLWLIVSKLRWRNRKLAFDTPFCIVEKNLRRS
ncbi:hypothetical protein C0V76_19350 [Uliginosibacterium sp. TH139]|nr:hypothetical protein C0V76_19350 [Uliginosibacterium sp. TH139]